MSASALKKERWTVTVDSRIKRTILAEARQRNLRPGQVLEELVREKLKPFGHTDIKNAPQYIRALRKKSREPSDDAFLADLTKWENITS